MFFYLLETRMRYQLMLMQETLNIFAVSEQALYQTEAVLLPQQTLTTNIKILFTLQRNSSSTNGTCFFV